MTSPPHINQALYQSYLQEHGSPVPCSICLEPTTPETFRATFCGHYYCATCVGKITVCSVCRFKLPHRLLENDVNQTVVSIQPVDPRSDPRSDPLAWRNIERMPPIPSQTNRMPSIPRPLEIDVDQSVVSIQPVDAATDTNLPLAWRHFFQTMRRDRNTERRPPIPPQTSRTPSIRMPSIQLSIIFQSVINSLKNVPKERVKYHAIPHVLLFLLVVVMTATYYPIILMRHIVRECVSISANRSSPEEFCDRCYVDMERSTSFKRSDCPSFDSASPIIIYVIGVVTDLGTLYLLISILSWGEMTTLVMRIMLSSSHIIRLISMHVFYFSVLPNFKIRRYDDLENLHKTCFYYDSLMPFYLIAAYFIISIISSIFIKYFTKDY
jgi:hypothetical protein